MLPSNRPKTPLYALVEGIVTCVALVMLLSIAVRVIAPDIIEHDDLSPAVGILIWIAGLVAGAVICRKRWPRGT